VLRPCPVCGTPTARPRCPAHLGAGYDQDHRARTAAAIRAEPWCHTRGGCPYPDAGADANPLTGGHPRTLVELGGDTTAWAAQPRIPQCLRCNSSRRPL
jgi:hypothetical protein